MALTLTRFQRINPWFWAGTALANHLSMKRTSLFMVAALALFTACAPQYTSENLCIDDDFDSLLPGLHQRYALGTEVRFELTHPVMAYETRIEITGDAFDWRELEGGVIEAQAVREGGAEIHVYIDGEIVRTRALWVTPPMAAEVAEGPSFALAVARSLCEDCKGVAGDEPRVALGSSTQLRIGYLDSTGEAIEGRELGDDDFVLAEDGHDTLDLFTELEGLFSLPVNVDGRQIAMVPYRVAELATLRIVHAPLGDGGWFFAEALDADGVTLLGDLEWFINDVPVELENGAVNLDDAAGATLRVRLGSAEATLEVLEG
ncbi:MAG: hypothetical protein ACI9KE_002376 [Polyangiales bacterium]|jgi:hypothetical protein